MFKKVITVAAGLALLGGMTACGSSSDGGNGGSGGDGLTMGFAQVGAESGWRSANTTSIRETAKKDGVDLKFSDAQQKQENQIKAIRSYIQQKVDVIAFSPVVETGWDAVLQEAKRAKIPVILTDRAVDSDDDSLYVTFLGSDFVEEGEKAGQWLVDNAQDADVDKNGDVNVVELQGTTGAAPAIDRKKGFEDVTSSDDAIKIIASQTGDFTRDGGKKVMEAFLQSHDDIDVVYAHNDDMGLGAIEAIEAAGKKPGTDIKIITVDAVKDGMTALSEGKINFIVECNPLLGPQLMELAKKVVAGEDVPNREEHVMSAGTAAARAETPAARPAPRADSAVEPVVELTGIEIGFPGVKALDGVSLRLLPGEVHALMGENGAGKSTLIKALTGVYAIDAGSLKVDGQEHRFSGPAESQAAGISTVYQEVNLCTNLTVAENMLLGREPRRLGRIHTRAMNRRAAEVLARLGLDVDPTSTLGSHPIAVQQLVAIARAVDVDAKVLVLDEPTSSLDADEVRVLFDVVRSLRDQGVAVLFVSHFLDQVFELSDRMTVLRNGRFVAEHRTAEITQLELVQEMIGRELEVLERLDRQPADPAAPAAEPVLKVVGLGRSGELEATDLALHEGEVVGVAGLLGSGRTELARLLVGADVADRGEVQVQGRTRPWRSPRQAIDAGVAFSSEDRRAEGVVGDLTVADNMILALQATRGWLRPVPQRTKDELVRRYIEALDIRPADPNALMRNLSGGNQQKVLLARWLITEPRLLVLDEPTRGIDVGAKAQIQQLVAELAADGMAVVFISAELEEVLRLADRVVVMRDRRKVAEQVNDGLEVSDVLRTIAGAGESAVALEVVPDAEEAPRA